MTDGDAKVKSTCSFKVGEPSAEFGTPVVLDYHFDPGWKFLNVRATGDLSKPLAGMIETVGMWIFGDGCGHELRMRYQDSTGQTFQPTYGPMDWRGWKYITRPITGTEHHWGGSETGRVKLPVTIHTLLVVDSAGGKGGTGQIKIGPVLVITK